MITQSDALKASGLQEHGFVYINLDSGWQGTFDQNGRPIPNSTTFPDIKAMVDHIHANGQKRRVSTGSAASSSRLWTATILFLARPYHTQDIVVTPPCQGQCLRRQPTLPLPRQDRLHQARSAGVH